MGEARHSTNKAGYKLATNTNDTHPTPVLKTSANILSTMEKTSTMATTYSSTIRESMKNSNSSGMMYYRSSKLINVIGSLKFSHYTCHIL